MRLSNGTREGITLLPSRPAFTRCAKCQRVSRTHRWHERDFTCPNLGRECDGTEKDMRPSTEQEFRDQE